ncbi:LamG-like jellyroll fold domain-containing protein [Candidatus Omnitrophota bacterium]
MKIIQHMYIIIFSVIAYLAVPDLADCALMDQWTFNQAHLKGKKFTNSARPEYSKKSRQFDASVVGSIHFTEKIPALKFEGSNYLMVDETVLPADLPHTGLTVEVWVTIDSETTDGGIVGYYTSDDSGGYGWRLGYESSYFTFTVSTGDMLTSIKSASPFIKGTWYHVAGIFDGTSVKLFVDGMMAASAAAPHDEIRYRDSSYMIGAYRDRNINRSLQGCLHRISVYDTALTDEEVYISYVNAGPVLSPEADVYPDTPGISFGPFFVFSEPGSAVIRWETKVAVPSVLLYGETDVNEHLIEDSTPKKNHIIELSGLLHNTVYKYAIITNVNGEDVLSNIYLCDTFFNYNRPQIPEQRSPYSRKQTDNYKELAKKILSETGVDQGLCLDIGCGDGNLAYELAKTSTMKIIGVDTDPSVVAGARKKLREAGVYGSHVTVHCVDSLAELPFRTHTFNLIVSRAVLDGNLEPDSFENYLEFLRPGRGVAYINRTSAAVRQLPVSRAGVWTHQYGGPHNASFGGESLSGATGTDTMDVQWLARPGPRAMVDRNSRVPAPLSVNGYLFTQGLNRIIAQDTYNGTILWSLEIPNSIRMNMPRDASNWCADSESVFMAVHDRCWVIDTARGWLLDTFEPVPGPRGDWDYQWGYIAQSGNNIFGSSVKPGSSYSGFWSSLNWYDRHTAGYKGQHGYGTGKVCSDNIFALDKKNGQKQWSYVNGVIINTTITIGDGLVYFVECRHPKVLSSETRQISMSELWEDQYLVALDQQTGIIAWERQIRLSHDIPVIFLAYGEGILLLVTSVDSKEAYDLYTYEARSGEKRWNQSHPWKNDNHSGHMQHPVIVNGRVFLEPFGYDLQSGDVLTENIGLHEGCATYAATTNALLYRGKNRQIALWDFENNKVTVWPRFRPGCWLTTIAADGLILSPEGGGGCSCGSWMETSVAFTPIRAFRMRKTGNMY